MGGMKQRQRGDEQEKENKGMCGGNENTEWDSPICVAHSIRFHKSISRVKKY